MYYVRLLQGGVTEMGSAGPSKVGAEDGSSEDDSSDEEGNWGSDDDEDDAEDRCPPISVADYSKYS